MININNSEHNNKDYLSINSNQNINSHTSNTNKLNSMNSNTNTVNNTTI